MLCRLRVVLCVDAVAVACFEDGSVSSEDLAAPDHLQRITHIVTQAHARRCTPSSPAVAAVVLAPPTEPGDAEPTVTYYDRFPPSVVAHIEEVIAQERRAKPDDVHEHAAIAAAMEAAAAYPCNRAPDLNRATTRWQPILAHVRRKQHFQDRRTKPKHVACNTFRSRKITGLC